MFRICVNYSEKRSTFDQYQNATLGATVEAANLELASPEAILEKTKQLFLLARSAVQAELLHAVPERPAALPHEQSRVNGHAEGNGHANGNGHQNGNGRSYGRPTPEPTPKQKMLLQRLAKERGLSPEQVGAIAKKELGRPVPQLDRNGLSKLIEILMSEVTS